MKAKRVKVTFYIEADEPKHRLGITEETFQELYDALLQLGAEDIDLEREHRIPPPGDGDLS